MNTIESTSNQKIKDLCQLHKAKGRKEQGRFLVEGWHMIREARDADILETILTNELQNLKAYPETECIHASQPVLNKLSVQSSDAKAIGVCRLQEIPLPDLNRILVLDRIQDPGNLGTLIRSACAFGMDAVICSPECADFHNPKVLQSTQGALFQIPVVRRDLVPFLRQLEIPVYGSCLHQDSVALQNISHGDSYALVVGNEGTGISADVLSCCSHLIHIEMDAFESLNAAVAGSILMYVFRYEKERSQHLS